jgi:FtsZ-binding cell division protein ZapB
MSVREIAEIIGICLLAAGTIGLIVNIIANGKRKRHRKEESGILERLKEENRQLALEAPSDTCARTNLQKCHCCDRIECGDNFSPAKKEIRKLTLQLDRLKVDKYCWERIAKAGRDRFREYREKERKTREAFAGLQEELRAIIAPDGVDGVEAHLARENQKLREQRDDWENRCRKAQEVKAAGAEALIAAIEEIGKLKEEDRKARWALHNLRKAVIDSVLVDRTGRITKALIQADKVLHPLQPVPYPEHRQPKPPVLGPLEDPQDPGETGPGQNQEKADEGE